MPKRRGTRVWGLVAVVASAASFGSGSATQAPDGARGGTARESGIPEGFHVVELPELEDVKRRRADRFRTDVEISNELRRHELNRIQERAGRSRSVWSTW